VHLSEISFEQQDSSVASEGPEQLASKRLNHLRHAGVGEHLYSPRAAAEFARPVMLYSIGKDSSVMLRLAQKAFFPAGFHFPCWHIDTSYKFPEMIAFRDPMRNRSVPN